MLDVEVTEFLGGKEDHEHQWPRVVATEFQLGDHEHRQQVDEHQLGRLKTLAHQRGQMAHELSTRMMGIEQRTDLAPVLRRGRLEAGHPLLAMLSELDHELLHMVEEIHGDQAQRLLAGVHLRQHLEPVATIHGATHLEGQTRPADMTLPHLVVLFSAPLLLVQCMPLHQEPTRHPHLLPSMLQLPAVGERTLRQHQLPRLPHRHTMVRPHRRHTEHQRLLLRQVPDTLMMIDRGVR